MYDTAEATGRRHMVCFTYRWIPPFRYLRHLIEDGFVGRCYHAHFRYEGGYGRAATYGWRFDRQQGTGILGDLGSHLIDLARWYLGDIVNVSGQLATFVARPGPDGHVLDAANDSALVALEFANGTQGTIHVSAVAHVGDRGLSFQAALYGDAGSLELEFDWQHAELRSLRAGEEQWRMLPVPERLWGTADRTAAFEAQVRWHRFARCRSGIAPSSMRLSRIARWTRPSTMAGKCNK